MILGQSTRQFNRMRFHADFDQSYYQSICHNCRNSNRQEVALRRRSYCRDATYRCAGSCLGIFGEQWRSANHAELRQGGTVGNLADHAFLSRGFPLFQEAPSTIHCPYGKFWSVDRGSYRSPMDVEMKKSTLLTVALLLF